MQIDELRSELTSLADEIPPFDGDLTTLHRHDRRRRVITSSLVAALVVVVAVATVAVIRQGRDSRVHVSGAGSKEVQSRDISHIDAIVVPATPAVKAALDSLPFVGSYARSVPGDLSSDSRFFTPDHGVCALSTNDGYVVDAAVPDTDISSDLQRALTGKATVYDESARFGADYEIFMQVGIAPEYSLAVQDQLAADPAVAGFRYLNTTDAYVIFKKDFADQPALVQSTKPSDLPESFRVIVKPGHVVANVSRRYAHLDGVGSIITAPLPALFRTTLGPSPSAKSSPCAKP
jgi:hypothetical protein